MGLPETLICFLIFAQIGILCVGYFLCKEFNSKKHFIHASATSFLWMSLSAIIVILIEVLFFGSRILALLPIFVSIIGFNTQIKNQKSE